MRLELARYGYTIPSIRPNSAIYGLSFRTSPSTVAVIFCSEVRSECACSPNPPGRDPAGDKTVFKALTSLRRFSKCGVSAGREASSCSSWLNSWFTRSESKCGFSGCVSETVLLSNDVMEIRFLSNASNEVKQKENQQANNKTDAYRFIENKLHAIMK